MIDLEKERNVFEKAAFQASGGWACFEKDSNGHYHSDKLNFGFDMWLKRAEQENAEIVSLKAQFAKVESSKAAFDVLGERNRQIEQEHYSIKHDDSYQMNELSRAAASYVNNVVSRGWVFNSVYGPEAYQSEEVPDLWPWSDEHWKPKNPRRDLVKAAALIIAEIDRMDRSSEGEQS